MFARVRLCVARLVVGVLEEEGLWEVSELRRLVDVVCGRDLQVIGQGVADEDAALEESGHFLLHLFEWFRCRIP